MRAWWVVLAGLVVGCGDASPAGDGAADSCGVSASCPDGGCELLPPRPWRPQSSTFATSRRPTFAWHLPAGVAGARIEVCADRACSRVEHSAEVTGCAYRLPEALAEGVHFWRLQGRLGSRLSTAYSATWLFRAPATEAIYDTAWRIVPDVDGDGMEDRQNVDGLTLSATGQSWRLARWSEPYMSWSYDHISSAQFAGDLDGDGYGDLVGVLSRSLSDPGGGFGVTYRPIWFRGGPDGPTSDRGIELNGLEINYKPGLQGQITMLSIGDVDSDGGADVGIVLDRGRNDRTRLYLASSSAGFAATEMGAFWFASMASLGDVDGDGRSEVLTYLRGIGPAANPPPSRVDARTATSGLTPLPTCGTNPLVTTAERVEVSDVNADGLADVTLFGRRTQRYLGGPTGFRSDRCEQLP